LETPVNRLEILGYAAAGIAHDINNHLTLILNHLSLKDADSARATTNRCAALTSSLLAYSRGEEPTLQAIDPVAFLQDFVDSLSLPGDVALQLDLPAALPLIQADPVALTRVLVNLVNNACDAMKQRGTLRLRASAGCMQVEDSGPGIPRPLRESVFQPFFSTKGSAGTGLGLAIARDLMRGQGGILRLVGAAPQGALFELCFRPAPRVV
jgi:signal transduction histidine kinase